MILNQDSPKQPKLTIGLSNVQQLKKRRIRDPFLDRRSGDDRREAYELGYFAQGSIEKEIALNVDKRMKGGINMLG